MRRAILAGAAALAFVATVAAGPYEDAIQALDQADLSESLRLLRQAGEEGHTGAQAILGEWYTSGYLQIRADPAEAARWYRMAAEQAHPEARFHLAGFYERGFGVDRDAVQAHLWYALAARAGHADAPARRDDLTTRMSAAELNRARALLQTWKPDG